MNKYDARKFADQHLGKESEMTISKNDPQYKYYCWLHDFFGSKVPTHTNKCPFYQYMFWASLVVVFLLPFYAVSKLADIAVYRPLKHIDWFKNFYDSEMISPAGLTLTTSISFFILLIIAAIFGEAFTAEINPIIMFFYLIHYLFAMPAALLSILADLFGKIYLSISAWPWSSILSYISQIFFFNSWNNSIYNNITLFISIF